MWRVGWCWLSLRFSSSPRKDVYPCGNHRQCNDSSPLSLFKILQEFSISCSPQSKPKRPERRGKIWIRLALQPSLMPSLTGLSSSSSCHSGPLYLLFLLPGMLFLGQVHSHSLLRDIPQLLYQDISFFHSFDHNLELHWVLVSYCCCTTILMA